MKKSLILSAAALLAALPAGAGVSIDRTSPSIALCGFPNPAQVFSLVPPTGGCDAGGAPVLEVVAPAFGLVGNDNVDALSTNTFTPPTLSYYLIFSADRASVGQAATSFNAEAANNQAASDLWQTNLTGNSPVAGMAGCIPFVVPPPHFLHRNQTDYNLIRTVPAGVMVAAPQDNIDAVEMDVLDITGDNIHDFNAYFSLDAASPSLAAGSPADIYVSLAGSGAFGVFSVPAQIGLQPGDNLDALVMWDRGVLGAPDPLLDFALFSLAPGSPTLAAFGLSPAMILVTDFNGTFCPFVGPGQLGMQVADNLDGLDVMP